MQNTDSFISLDKAKTGLFIFFASFLTLLFLLPLSGCSKGKKKMDLSDYELLTFGEKDMSKERYAKARESFQRIIDEYPDSELRKEALLRLGDSYYNNEDYEEAKIEYTKYLEMFPATPMAAKAQYYLAMSSFMMVRNPERDQTATRQALKEFDKVIKKYPGSEFAKKAAEKMQVCNLWLAQGDFNIAMFYYKQKAYQSAIWRFSNLLKKGAGLPFYDKVIFYMGNSYYEVQDYEKASDLYRKLLSSYPNSPLAPQAQKRLSSSR